MKEFDFKTRLLIAAVLCGLVILVYPWLVNTFLGPRTVANVPESETVSVPPPTVSSPLTPSPELKQETSVSAAPEPGLLFAGQRMNIYFWPQSASIAKITLPRYRDGGNDYVLIDARDPQTAPLYLATSLDDKKPLAWTMKKISDTAVTFSSVSEGVELEKTWRIKEEHYLIEQTLVARNITQENKNFTIYLIGTSYINREKGIDERFVESSVNVDGKFYRIADAKIKKETQSYTGYITWSGVRNRYFSSMFKSIPGIKNGSVFFLADHADVINQVALHASLSPAAQEQFEFMSFNGPTDYDTLKPINMHDTITYGAFDSISKMILFLLRGVYAGVRNWGLAIIFLTILINIVLFPFTFGSIKSMARLQKLNPKIAALREKYKGDNQRINKETMELYRSEKVNPFGGCLPLLLQMPIFIALYQALMKSVSLKGSGFLWIRDLALPDRFFKLHTSIPLLGEYVNVLPVIMMAAMFLQQKISSAHMADLPPEQQQQQKIMLFMMPILFAVMFYHLPSGLVLYWLTNTIIMAFEQKMVMKQIG